MTPIELVKQKAKSTLEANIVQTKKGTLLAAGGQQFRSLWVRDFCYSVPGLLRAGHEHLVRNQLQTIFSAKNKQGWLPRGLDVISPKVRVIWNLFISHNPKFMDYAGRPLNPEYLGEHKTVAFDSNLLFILAHESYEIHTAQKLFSPSELKDLLSVYKFGDDGLLHQPPYSDWQDSAKREGPILLSQLLYSKAARYLSLHDSASKLDSAVMKTFFNKNIGLFHETPKSEQISLDSHLFILKNKLSLKELDFDLLYRNLKNHRLWGQNSVPGVPVSHPYPSNEVSWTLKAIGLKKYHDGMIWGWLVADSYACARLMGDDVEADRILRTYCESIKSDLFLSEIYTSDGQHLKSYEARIYKSESPFSWTAAKWLEAL
jgi:glycogen debranching enzyme